MLPVLLITHLPHLPLYALILMFPFFMMAVSGRNVPLQALMTTVPDPVRRGAFLSANSAVQQLGTGMGAFLGGLLLTSDAAGHIAGYGTNGWISAGLTVLAMWWIGRVQSAPAALAPSATAARVA
jgi:predicted MFS family arabinose efflux permease